METEKVKTHAVSSDERPPGFSLYISISATLFKVTVDHNTD